MKDFCKTVVPMGTSIPKNFTALWILEILEHTSKIVKRNAFSGHKWPLKNCCNFCLVGTQLNLCSFQGL
jgi:hypothetical protein